MEDQCESRSLALVFGGLRSFKRLDGLKRELAGVIARENDLEFCSQMGGEVRLG